MMARVAKTEVSVAKRMPLFRRGTTELLNILKKATKSIALLDVDNKDQISMDVQMEDIKRAFMACDNDGSGVIDIDEFSAMVARLDLQLNKSVEEVFDDLDNDQNGVLQLEEFLDALKDHNSLVESLVERSK